jgi:hypothetical protein
MAKTRKRSIKTHKGTKKLKARVPTKVTGRNFTKMDVDEPAYKEIYAPVPMDIDEELPYWRTSTDVDRETIVTRDFLQKELPKISADYTPPTIHKGLVMHGSSMNERFTLPPNIEVVIFSRRGQVITVETIDRSMKWVSKNFGELRTSNMEKYNRKTFVLKTTTVLDRAFQRAYTNLDKETPEYTTARRFDKSRSYYTATIQIFRAGDACPNISLSNDEDVGGTGISRLNGLWDFSPLKKDDVMTDVFIKAIPFPKTISLKDLLQDQGLRDKHLRLYLFCCRVEVKGAEVPNSQASNASQKSRVGLTEEGDVFSFPKASDSKVQSKSGLASSFLGSRRK